MPKKLEITLKSHLFDPEGASLCRRVSDYFGWQAGEAKVISILTLDAGLSDSEIEAVRVDVFTNPVTQVSSCGSLASGFDWGIWVGYRPGVRDTAGSVAIDAISDYLGRALPPDAAAYTSKLYLLKDSPLLRSQAETLARELLANEIIHQWRVYSGPEWDESGGKGVIVPKVVLAHTPSYCEIPIESDDRLARLSDERNLALNRNDIPVIRNYFLRPEVLDARAKFGLRAPTDVELEAISQARSDHCNHNTFRGKFHYSDLVTGEEFTVNNLFKTCIEAPTLRIQQQKDWVVSVLWDNAGVARFDADFNYSVTGETHNSPSNMEAYGGALTGIVGIYRDIMGTGKGSRLVAGLYGYCVGPRDYNGPAQAPPSSQAAARRNCRRGKGRRQQARSAYAIWKSFFPSLLPGQMPGVRGVPRDHAVARSKASRSSSSSRGKAISSSCAEDGWARTGSTGLRPPARAMAPTPRPGMSR